MRRRLFKREFKIEAERDSLKIATADFAKGIT